MVHVENIGFLPCLEADGVPVCYKPLGEEGLSCVPSLIFNPKYLPLVDFVINECEDVDMEKESKNKRNKKRKADEATIEERQQARYFIDDRNLDEEEMASPPSNPYMEMPNRTSTCCTTSSSKRAKMDDVTSQQSLMRRLIDTYCSPPPTVTSTVSSSSVGSLHVHPPSTTTIDDDEGDEFTVMRKEKVQHARDHAKIIRSMQKRYPEDEKLVKMLVHTIVKRFEQTGSVIERRTQSGFRRASTSISGNERSLQQVQKKLADEKSTVKRKSQAIAAYSRAKGHQSIWWGLKIGNTPYEMYTCIINTVLILQILPKCLTEGIHGGRDTFIDDAIGNGMETVYTFDNSNDLLKSVAFDIQEQVLQLNLEEYSKDSSALLDGETLFPDEMLAKDDVASHRGMLFILERKLKDQLKGGKYYSPGNNERLRVAAGPTTNSCSERDFAQLDVVRRLKPAASIECFESIIMWTNNETSAWLADKTKSEREDIIEQARKDTEQMQLKIKEKRNKLMSEKLKQ
ncbi:hypothetical protein MAR_025549 [Mya arenaria]|uniref:Uncharacterized protein n=1 Tax=Mya arenaria TaxID=6604 RepID=A0ABY7EQF9_MYAAR|nr:hypothetical protein MAR_025549 [Mya arenaria]